MAKWLATENAPDNDSLSLVAAIRKSRVPCFVASSQERLRAQYLTSEMQFDHLFDGLFFSCDLGFAKPEDGFFRAITQRLGHSESELVFFDDAFQNVTAAKAAGWVAEQFTGGDQLRQHIAQFVGHHCPTVPQERKAARLLVIDKDRRVLLFQYEDRRGKW